VDAALSVGVKVFVQESFAPAYPDGGDRWIDETRTLAPAAYNRSVMNAEAALMAQNPRTLAPISALTLPV
jgi:hypothetical protein